MNIGGWHISYLPVYVLAALIGTLLIRVGSSFLKAIDKHHVSPDSSLKKRFVAALSGNDKTDDEKSDDWHPTVLGFLELLCIPPFIVSNQWHVIGGWLAIKTVASWKAWEDRRSPYNRFLICTLAMLMYATIVLTPFIK